MAFMELLKILADFIWLHTSYQLDKANAICVVVKNRALTSLLHGGGLFVLPLNGMQLRLLADSSFLLFIFTRTMPLIINLLDVVTLLF